MSERAAANAGKAPAFAPACLAWVGGSLAGYVIFSWLGDRATSLSTTVALSKPEGVEVARERWDEEDARNAEDDMDISLDSKLSHHILPDWTRTPLSAGAPPANVRPVAA